MSMGLIGLILKKDLKGLFKSPLIYILGAFFILALGGIFFNSLVLIHKQKVYQLSESIIPNFIGNINFLLMVMLPLISMRSFSDEKRNFTLDLLFRSPLTDLELIMGKFLAQLIVLIFLLSLTLLFPVILIFNGGVEMGVFITGLLGTFFNGITFISIGLIGSLIFPNVFVGAFINFALNFLLVLLSYAPLVLDNFYLGQLIGHLSLPFHFEPFTRGAMRGHDLIYYVSAISFFLFILSRIIQFKRRSQ
jgi:ABC-2 type transport system permease protein